MFTVQSPAESTALTTLDAVKSELRLKGADDDDWLNVQIDAATAAVTNYLGIEMADDGTRTLGRETLVETLDRRSRYPWVPPFGVIVPRREADAWITLARRPVVSIASITENGTAVDPTDFLLEATTGKVKRLSSALPASWPCTIIVVTYTAGWLLPEDDGRNLPVDIEQAVVGLVKSIWFGRSRDPNLKSEEVTGVWRADYFFGAPGRAGALPPDVTAMLDPYRNLSL